MEVQMDKKRFAVQCKQVETFYVYVDAESAWDAEKVAEMMLHTERPSDPDRYAVKLQWAEAVKATEAVCNQ
jgi:hypothetical protein